MRKEVEVNPYLAHFGSVNEFMEANEKLVHYIVKRYSGLTKSLEADYEDLFNEGMIGMLKAYRKYDPSRFEGDIKFSTCAVPMIEGEIRRSLRDTGHGGVNFSRGLRDMFYRAKKEDILDETDEYIALKFGATVEKVKDMRVFAMNSYTTISRLEEPLFDSEGEPLTLKDQLQAYGQETDGNIAVFDALNRLNAKQREAIILYSEGYSQVQTGVKMGLSQVQVSRLIKSAKIKIKEYLEVPDAGEEREMARGRGNAVGDMEKAMLLISTTNKKYREIAEETGCNYATVAFHGRNIRGQKKRHPMNGPVITRKLTDEEKSAYSPEPKEEEKDPVVARQLPNVELKDPEETTIEKAIVNIRKTIDSDRDKTIVTEITPDEKVLERTEPIEKAVPIPVRQPVQSNVAMSFDKKGLSMEDMRKELENILSAMELMGLENLDFNLQISTGRQEPVAV